MEIQNVKKKEMWKKLINVFRKNKSEFECADVHTLQVLAGIKAPDADEVGLAHKKRLAAYKHLLLTEPKREKAHELDDLCFSRLSPEAIKQIREIVMADMKRYIASLPVIDLESWKSDEKNV